MNLKTYINTNSLLLFWISGHIIHFLWGNKLVCMLGGTVGHYVARSLKYAFTRIFYEKRISNMHKTLNTSMILLPLLSPPQLARSIGSTICI